MNIDLETLFLYGISGAAVALVYDLLCELILAWEIHLSFSLSRYHDSQPPPCDSGQPWKKRPPDR